MINKYKKKPVVIEAIQFDGTNQMEIANFMGKSQISTLTPWSGKIAVELYIETLEGKMTASKDDYIIKGIKGEFYPCKPDIFEATYEKVIE